MADRRVVANLATVGVLALCAASLSAQADRAPQRDSSRQALVALIDKATASPLTDLSLWKALADSASARSDVDVVYSPAVAPWMCPNSRYTGPSRWKGLLVTAFIAGNMREQLVSGRKQNEPVAGVRGVLQVYAKLKEVDGSLVVPEIDEWRRLDADSALARHITNAVANSPRACPQ